MNKTTTTANMVNGIEYPCLFPIKIMGINDINFLPECIAIIRKHCQHFNPEKDITTKTSAHGKYVSMTANITAESKAHLDELYKALNAHELVKFTL